MSSCEHFCKNHEHICGGHSVSNLNQTLDELDFERGIWYAAQFGDFEKVQKLIRNGVDVDLRDSAGYTSLHYAARNGHLNICKLLLENKADIDAVTRSGRATALHRACSAGHVKIVKYLVEQKADGKLIDGDGKTVLHRAAEVNNFEICQTITSTYPELRMLKDNKGKLPVDYVTNDLLCRLFDIN